ncbi:MAG TPA: cytochrome C, partial [Burkholderiales bacterium]|nr:cytochrome C [Burkholderiales bacterium]
RDDKHKSQLGNDCRACHSERSWQESSFKHIRSRFPLLGRHADVECRKCHASPAFKDAKVECVSCHAKDDKHKGRFVPKCEDCHNAEDWKRSEYDHDRRTHFKLEGAHLKAACHACHKQPVKDKLTLSSECLTCHKDDDTHLGTYGPLCQRCHVAENWRKIVKREGMQPLPASQQ